MNKQYLLFLLLLRIPSLCQLPPNFWELHRPSPTSPSPILWLNNHCEINDADPSFVPCDPLQCYFQWFSRVGAHLENATGAPETPSHVHFQQRTWSADHEKRTPPWHPPSFMAGSSQITGINTCDCRRTSVYSHSWHPTTRNWTWTPCGFEILVHPPSRRNWEFFGIDIIRGS